jgi:hypothetical protein
MTKDVNFAATLISAEGFTMPAYASDTPILLIKKLGGMLLLIPGILLVALGLVEQMTWLTILGILLMAGGAFLLALKVIRRNRGRLP